MAARSLRIMNQLYARRSTTLCVGGACIGHLLHHSAVCRAEAHQRRKRPPKFGSSMPSISSRGISMSGINIDEVNSNREDCPMCKKFGSGPCGGIFKRWLDCTDQHPGKDADGQPLHLSKCFEFARKLSKCLDDNSDYYTKYDEKRKSDESDEDVELKVAWSEFVKETEEQIISRVYQLQEFPLDVTPTIHVRLESRTGAASFKPQRDDGSSIVVAYILDENGNVLAAGSKEDMDMGSQFGCILQFDMPATMKAATCRVIYEEGNDNVTVFSKTMLVPGSTRS
ncbi:hypothetical protein ACHAWO_008168 [Cyclotella atomus]|uniref:GCK domain-containing protein n=1 Tax=Cyclotella atomus TaxID=382360 RepID=A0ABD3PL58_9STRA